MPIHVHSDVYVGTGAHTVDSTSDPFLITSTGAIISTNSYGLVGQNSNQLVIVFGRLQGALSALWLGADVNGHSNQTIRVGDTGYVFGEVDGIHIDARNSNVRNEGIVAGRQQGIEINGASGTSRIVNSGTIMSDAEGIRSTGAQTLIIENTGTIFGETRAIATFGGATAHITNTGEIVGEIYLDAGNDVYNGVNGRVNGSITCFGGNDTVYSGVDDDVVRGMTGNDTISSAGGNDTLLGDSGSDKLNGGLGADMLTGGTEADQFIFSSASDSTVAASGRDLILDFSRTQGDRINLSPIDANTTLAGNQTFKFIGSAAFTDKAGELRYAISGSDTFIQGDVNGDGTTDFAIVLDRGLKMISADFYL